MNNSLLVVHYLLWATLLVAAAKVLHAYRGASLLAIWTIGVALQLGAAAAVAGNIEILRLNLSFAAMERYGWALVVSYALLLVFLSGLWVLRPRAAGRESVQPVIVTPLWMVVGLLLLGWILAIDLRSAGGQTAMEFGRDVLGGGGYYQLRGELIKVQNASASRWDIYFGATVRQILLLLLIAAGLNLGRRWSSAKAVFVLAIMAGLGIAGVLLLEKTPVLLALAGGGVPFLLRKLSRGRAGVLRIVLRLSAVFTLLLCLGAALYSLTEGNSPVESARKVLTRVFLLPSSGSAMYFEAYPDLIPFTQWADFRPARMLLGNDALRPQEASIAIEVAKVLTGHRYNLNVAFVGESWAAAGYWGVVVGTIFMGVFCFVTDRLVARAARGISLFPLAIYYWLGFTSFGNGGFLYCVVELGLWLVPAFYCLVLGRRAAIASRRTRRSGDLDTAPHRDSWLPAAGGSAKSSASTP